MSAHPRGPYMSAEERRRAIPCPEPRCTAQAGERCDDLRHLPSDTGKARRLRVHKSRRRPAPQQLPIPYEEEKVDGYVRLEEHVADLAEAEDVARRAAIELKHWRTVVAPELAEERDRARSENAALRSALLQLARDSIEEKWEEQEFILNAVLGDSPITDDELIGSGDAELLAEGIDRWRRG